MIKQRALGQLVLAAGLMLALLDRPAHVAAQKAEGPSLGDLLQGEARSSYDSARALYGVGDYAGALVKFNQAYQQSGEPRLLWNMAACEKDLRHYTRTLALLLRYRQEADARLSEAQRAQSEELIRTVRMLISSVNVVVNEPDAAVFVDDELIGKTPLASPALVDLGLRTFRVEKPGFEPLVLNKEFSGGSELTLQLTLQVKRPVVSQLAVAAGAGDTIALDGVALGQGQWRGQVGAGAHSLRVSAPDKKPYELTFALRPGESRQLDVSLESARRRGKIIGWTLGAVLIAAGLGVGGYFLFRPQDEAPEPTVGSLAPGVVQLP